MSPCPGPCWGLSSPSRPRHCQAQASPCPSPGASLDDQAVYICEAQNEFGKIEAEVKLTVTGHGLLLRALAAVSIPAAAGAGREQAAEPCSHVCSELAAASAQQTPSQRGVWITRFPLFGVMR